MAIFTKWGDDEVEVIAGSAMTGEVNIRFKNGEYLQTYISELRADDGIREIETAIKLAKFAEFDSKNEVKQ